MVSILSKSKLVLLVLVLSSLSFGGEAKKAHIEFMRNGLDRCRAKITKEHCEKMRQKALSSDCITQDELEILESYGACPLCFDDEYVGWCPAKE